MAPTRSSLRRSDPERRSDSGHRRRGERCSDLYHLWPDHVRRRSADHAVVNEAGVLARRSGRPKLQRLQRVDVQ
jgi:hypothetical protein